MSVDEFNFQKKIQRAAFKTIKVKTQPMIYMCDESIPVSVDSDKA